MKKLFKTLAFALVGAWALVSCEDVPAPYTTPEKGSTTEEVVTASGTGTADDPFNVKGVQEYIEGDNFDANAEVYFKGIITSFKEAPGNTYGNATFYVADTPGGSNTFYVYRCYGLNGNKFTDASNLSVGDTVVIKSTVTNYNGTLETVQNKGQVVTINGKAAYPGNDTPDTPAEGIEVTCAKAAEIANALADNGTSEETYTVTGYITEVFATVSKGQQSFWMADTKDGGKVLQAYWANLPEGVEAFTAGSKVKITGQIIKYVKTSDGSVTPEIKNATVEIIEKADGGNTDKPTTDATEVSCAKAAELALTLEDKATSTETYSVTGYITEIVGSVSKNQQTFWMADTKDGGKVFEAYWANLPEGISEFTVGSKVKITGQLMHYGTTPEIKNATVEILEKAEGGNTDEPGGDDEPSATSSLENGGFEAWTSDAQPTGWKSASTASNATLSKSTDAHSGTYAVIVTGNESANKRLASQEIELEAGTYKFSFYAKATADPSQVRPGYVPVVDGKVGSYVYGDYATLSTGWTLVEYEFTLDAKATVCLVVMNPKKSSYSSGANVLIDDATLVKK